MPNKKPAARLAAGLPAVWPLPLGVPKYAQLRDALIVAIESGRFQPGSRLPTEQELARTTPFSLGTVQRALRELVESGVVVRRQGSGSFIADSRKAMDAPWHCRFIADDGVSLLPVYPRVRARERVRERGPWSAHLDQREGELIRIDRVIGIADEFSVFSKFYLDARRFPGILDKPLADLDGANLKLIISREFGLPVTRVAQTVSFTAFPAAVCAALGLKRETSGTLLEIAASAGRGRAVYYQELFIPPNRRRLVISDTYETNEA